MRKFTFGLQTVFDHRRRIEDERQLTLAEKQRHLEKVQARLEELNGEFRSHSEVLRRDHRALSTEDLRLHYGHLDYLDRAIAAQIRVVAERRAAIECARIDLLVASKDRKMMEKLKAHRFEAHQDEERRIEQEELDDGNARRYDQAKQNLGEAT
ncbi:MAG TPA: flagellar export protein FliJ [Verrucomicrobiae bacterium]|jgi:flagellar FliJ protein|nr:flagellar export protein FliJ [Verrucomicrobiae bacterium]